MPRMIWTTGALAALAIAWTGSMASAADKDTVLLGGKSTPKLAGVQDDVMTLQLTGDEDTILTKHGRYYGGYGYGRGYGGYGRGYGGYGRGYGGYGRGYGGYGYGGYGRGYGGYGRYYGGFGYSSFYRPYYSFGFGIGYGYRPYYYGSYYSYNWAPSYYYYSWPSYYLINGDIDQTAPVTTLEMKSPNGGFDYNGGPDNPVPLPKKEGRVDPPGMPLDGRPVSLPAPKAEEKKSKFAYPAYGEEPGRTDFATDRKASKR